MEDIKNYDQELQGKEPKKSQQDTENNEIVLHSEEKKQNSVTDIFERMVGKDLNIPSYRHYTFLKKYEDIGQAYLCFFFPQSSGSSVSRLS